MILNIVLITYIKQTMNTQLHDNIDIKFTHFYFMAHLLIKFKGSYAHDTATS